MTTPAAKKINRLSDFIIEEVSLVDRPANKRRFLMFKRDEGSVDITDEVLQPVASDEHGNLSPIDAPTDTPAAKERKPSKEKTMTTPTIKGIEAVEQIFFKVGDAVDRLMRVASVTLQADSLKLEDGPNPGTVVKEIEAVQSLLEEVKGEIATTKGLLKSDSEPAEPTATDAPKGAVEALEEVVEALKVRKAGAKMSAARLARFASALDELKTLLREVGGDTKKGVTEPSPAPTTPAPAAAPEESTVVKSLRSEVADLRKQVHLLKSSPAPSQALAVEGSEPTPVAEEDYAWPADMNKPLGEGDVPVEKSFYG